MLPLSLPEDPQACHYWPPLCDLGLALACTAALPSTDRMLVILTKDTRQARQLTLNMHYLQPDMVDDIVLFPDWETLPYDYFSPQETVVAKRISGWYRLMHQPPRVLIMPIHAFGQRIPPRSFIAQESFVAKVGATFESHQVRRYLTDHGYHAVQEVVTYGEFAQRGGIFDIFPTASETPFRIELFGDEIESLRSFDPETQRSLQPLQEVQVLPAKEFPLDDDSLMQFRQRWREHFTGKASDCPIYNDVSQGLCPAGVEAYLPLFFAETATWFDHLPDDVCFLQTTALHEHYINFWTSLQTRFEQYSHDRCRPLLPPEQLYQPTEQLFQHFKHYPRVALKAEVPTITQPLPDVAIRRHAIQALQACLETHREERIVLVTDSLGRQDALLTLLKRAEVTAQTLQHWGDLLTQPAGLYSLIAPFEQGCYFHREGIVVITESELYPQAPRAVQTPNATIDHHLLIKNLAELTPGDPVVHVDHGVGRYRGLHTLTVGGQQQEFVMLTYADDATLYVPITALDLIHRYGGHDQEHAPLHRLGGQQWQQAKQKAAQKVRDAAADLLEIYARREAQTGFAFTVDPDDYERFCQEFPYQETLDQHQAIQAVYNDMTSTSMMDRLICGDVGFGKTEVAMRAAFIATQSSKQVAILVPTTLLAQQHEQNFKHRFAGWPITIASLSRFQTATEQRQVIANLASGGIDIVIGTHKLLQERVKFHDLRLLILDEEHRFGVRQKEKLKAMRCEIDILALTATPIPRTLNFALAGIRDLSIIATPPVARLAIKTFIMQRQQHVIREAIMREITRGGQVYFVHNRIATIDKVARELAAWIPEARIAIGHGQMAERQLERIMTDFHYQRHNVLVCTSIIENGIDIPTANTIIIDRADHFGLAQLHQIRGRVGRSHQQAYAYLLVPEPQHMTADSVKRIEAFANLTDLGVGFQLATHDLEIRGAGELLGEEQSGHLQTLGLNLYLDLLERAVKTLRTGVATEPVATHHTEVQLGLPCLLPEDYIPDVSMRLLLYKRLAHAEDEVALDTLQIELIDRFGLLPPAGKNLLAVTTLKLQAGALGIAKIEMHAKGGCLEFREDTCIDPVRVFQMIQAEPKAFKFEGATRLRLLQPSNPEHRIASCTALLARLASKDKASDASSSSARV